MDGGVRLEEGSAWSVLASPPWTPFAQSDEL